MFTKKSVQQFLSGLISILNVIYVFLTVFLSREIYRFYYPTNRNSRSEKICNSIKTIRSNGSIIYIYGDFSSLIDQSILSSYLVFDTSALNSRLVFPPNTLKPLKLDKNVCEFEYDYPFIQKYIGVMHCINPKSFIYNPYQKPSSVSKYSHTSYHLKVEIRDFVKNSSYSQMKCYGNDFVNRYCDTRYLYLFRGSFYFISEVYYMFPKKFLSTGGFPPPNDPKYNQLESIPTVVSHMPKNTSFIQISEISYYIGRFHNSIMLWHAVYDFVVPLLKTIYQFESSIYPKKRRFYIRDIYKIPIFPELTDCLSDFQTVYDINSNENSVFCRMILGMIKHPANSTIHRSEIANFDFEYNFEGLSSTQYRDLILESLEIENTSYKTEIVILQRKSSSRKILNLNEIIDALNKICQNCTITVPPLETMLLKDQIKTLSKANILIGAHGSGLSHVMWMKPGSHIYEILPNGYTCRNWFKSAAQIARVNYHAVESNLISNNSIIANCIRNNLCTNQGCHDVLRDQKLTVTIETIQREMSQTINELTL